MTDNRRQGTEDLPYVRLLEEQLHAHRNNLSYALATIVDTDQKTTRTQGKMMVYEDGTAIGTVGGGALEARVIHDARQAIPAGKGGLFHYDMNGRAAEEGLACGGSMSVLIEVYGSRPVLVMCGAGHVGGCVMRLARLTGFQVILADERPGEMIADKIDIADRFIPIKNYEEDLSAAGLPEGAFYVLAGPNHDADKRALAAVLNASPAYVGMIGGKPKIHAIFEKLRAAGYSRECLNQVYTPIGLDVSNETPEEIAVSILAEVLMVKNQKGRPEHV